MKWTGNKLIFIFIFLQWRHKPSKLKATPAQSNKWLSNPKLEWISQTKTPGSKPSGGMKGLTCSTWNTGMRAHHHHTWENKIRTHSQLCRYCPLWTQRNPHDFKTRLQGYEESYLYNTRSFPPLSDVGCHKHPPMQTQCPRCVPQDCGPKQTNTLMEPNKPHTEVGDRLWYHL